MGLIKEIQDSAVDASTDVSVALRKCLVLASRIELPELKAWAEHELNGYPEVAELPPYRVFSGEARGNFVGGIPAFGMKQLTNTPIPLGALPEEYRERFRWIRLQQPISDIEEMVEQARKGEGSTLRSPWPAEFFLTYCSGIFTDMECLSAWTVITVGQLRAVVEAVRNRLLSFVLELPKIQDETPSPARDTQREALRVFNLKIMGNVSNLSAAGGDITQTAINIQRGNWPQLKETLDQAGVPAESVGELKSAIDADGEPEGRSLGRNVQAWFGRMMMKAASGAWDISAAAAGQLLANALASYYDLQGG